MMTHDMNRRQFLKHSSIGLMAAPLVGAFRLHGAEAPSNRITMGCIGVGGRGGGNMSAFLNDRRVQVIAVCDVDRKRAESAARRVEGYYAKRSEGAGKPTCSSTQDFREILARPDIDAVMIGTPDHTHALISIWAMRAGKDVYCEKPLAYTVAEGRAIVEAAERYGRVLQTGTQRRSVSRIRHACELVLNGRIGEVKMVRVGLPRGFAIRNGASSGNPPAEPVPEWLDYDKWLGPAPQVPYTPARCHFNFRWILDYGEGYISDWGAHYVDVAHWGIGADHTGPLTAKAEATFPQDGLYDAPTDFHITFTYPGGVTMTCSTKEKLGIGFEGSEGTIGVEQPGSPQVSASDPKILKSEIGPGEKRLYRARNHHTNFIDCVISREQTSAPAETGHRSASACHVGMIAARLGHDVRWDPKAERFIDDPQADRLLFRPMRAPWVI